MIGTLVISWFVIFFFIIPILSVFYSYSDLHIEWIDVFDADEWIIIIGISMCGIGVFIEIIILLT